MLKIQGQKRTSPIIPLTVLAGAIVGSAVTLLFAPKKGSDFRNGMKERAKALKSGFNNAVAKSRSESRIGSQSYNKTTMHPVETNNSKDQVPSKAAAMVNHLKQNKHEGNQFPNPL